ncbi:MAG: Gfo/Idh/MocA family oxidoreductase [Azospirillaceae bacterium]
MDTIRFGIVGSGYMAKLHSLALRNLEGYLWPDCPRLVLARMADIAPDSARDGAARWGWHGWTGDWREVTRAADIDAVIVITPNDSHAEIAIDAFEHGKHVFCEKPLSNRPADAERMVAAQARSARVGMVNFAYRTWPAVALARELVETGEIGEVLHFDGRFFQDYAADPETPHSWRFDRAVAGGGAFADIGSHITDIACALAGPVERVAAASRRLHDRRPAGGEARPVTVDDLTGALVVFRGGAMGAIHACWAAPGHKSSLTFTLVGTEGSVRFDWESANALEVYLARGCLRTNGFRRVMIGGIHPDADPFWFAQGQGLGYGEAFVITARKFVEAVRDGRTPPGPDFREALHVARVVAAVDEAAASGSWVPVAGDGK